MNGDPAGRATHWDPASDDVKLVHLVDLLCGIQQELALHLLSVMYTDPEEDREDEEPQARPA
jgi:hypothetical protein